MDSNWIAQYWIEVGFGLICAGLAIFFRYFIKLLKKSFEDQKKEFSDDIDAKLTKTEEKILNLMDSKDEKMMKEILDRESSLTSVDCQIRTDVKAYQENFDKVQKGVLSIQGRAFKLDCRHLLEDDHEITLNEYINITEEHSVYNALGGNHEGDQLYELVDVKYKNSLNPQQK